MEILLRIIIEPIMTLLFEKPIETLEQSTTITRLPKWCRVLLFIVICLVMISVMLLITLGAVFLVIGKTDKDRENALIMLLSGLAGLVIYIVVIIIKINIDKRRKQQRSTRTDDIRPDRTALRKIVHIVVDRPIGSIHPEHPDIVYDVNYGFVPAAIGGDGEAQDAYVLGVDEPISEFDGVVVAIIHRLDDNEDKWVVAPSGSDFSDEDIVAKTEFQERFFKTEIIR